MNGQWTEVGAAGVRLTDPGLLAGLGVFETLGVRDVRPLDLDEHLERLAGSSARLGIDLPEARTLRQVAAQLAERSAGAFGWIKILATRGGECAAFGGAVDPAEAERPCRAILLPWRRSPDDPLAGLKTLNYAPFALGLELARSRGCDEALWRNSRGHLAEGCRSSLFLVQHRKVFTSSLRDGILPGVTQGIAVRAARDLGHPVHEGKLRPKRLLTCHEAFVTSSVLGVRPLIEVDGRPIGKGAPGPVTRAIADAVLRLRTGHAATTV
jgi:branched-subunit amino acid aminotransferase/4-amino-4-deoxychorismate lyase